jgi:RHS repeat-associated protein
MGAKIDEILALTSQGGTFFYHQDGLGSVTATTGPSGNLVEAYQYDLFGAFAVFDSNGLPVFASPSGNRFCFTGREWLEDAGIFDYRYRVYNAALGRFHQNDLLRFSANDSNMYRYAANQPSIATDPTGTTTYLCSSPAFGIPGINHVYLYDTEKMDRCERFGKSGKGSPSMGGNKSRPSPGDYCQQVDTGGKDQSLWDCCEEEKNDGPYIPGLLDCHTPIDDCFKKLGIKGPKHPRLGDPCCDKEKAK